MKPHRQPEVGELARAIFASKITAQSLRRSLGFSCGILLCICCLSCSNKSDVVSSEPTPVTNESTKQRADATVEAESAPDTHVVVEKSDSKNSTAAAGSSSKHESPEPNLKEEASETDAAHISVSTQEQWWDDVKNAMDPGNDGWDTEVFSDRASKQLKHLGKLIAEGPSPTGEDVSPLLSEGFTCSVLRPDSLREVMADESVTVRRPQELPQSDNYKGPQGLATSIAKLTALFDGTSDKHFKFKLFRVTPKGREYETISYFELSGRKDTASIQETATWRCRWKRAIADGYPRLVSITLEDYEEVEIRNSNRTLFSDCTESLFRDAPAYKAQLRLGIDYWRARLETYLGIYYDGHHGVTLGDINGDGLDDVYLCEPGGLPNRLLIQTPEGLLKDVSADSGIDLLDATRMVLLADIDNDGDQDLIAAFEYHVHFFANDGTGRFSRKAKVSTAGESAYSLAIADFDEDGRLDVYACFYHGPNEKVSNRSPAPIPYHDARSGGFNRLLRNMGNWQFKDVTDLVGLDHNNDRWSFAAAWEDFDNDGDLDLYVANDFGRNNLYQQEDGRFQDVAGPAGAEDKNFGMSVSFGDYNRDGWLDIYVSNMFSAAGGRITFQPDFQTDGTEAAIAALQRMSEGNTLLKNDGDGTFKDVSTPAHVGVGRWAWASLFADINNDCWEDLLVANGFVTGDLPDDL